ncbi:hypothetical protein FHW84_003996 [Dyella sp. SG562]|uniref:S41 family peptidase n=1 Tax=Dyella sp. SG562 TaxID=2587017 RepID=UPI0014232BBF|nr:S41 family peptidase [Dyella sp. SG562]NII75387.1 hypothetical protein [Dyella sp. SG562]
MIPLLSAALMATALASAPAPYDAHAWRADFAQLKTALQARYVNLAWMGSYESGIDVPALTHRAELALDAAHSDAEARDVLRAFVAGFHDGHLSELATQLPAQGDAPEPEKATLDPADPASGCAAMGYASTASVAFSQPFESLPGVHLLGDGQSSVLRIGTADVDGRRIGLVRLQVFRARGFPQACLRAWAQARQAATPITRAAIGEAARYLWLKELAEQLKALRSAGAQAVIVDVGNNGGGDDSGDWIPRLFGTRPVASSRLLLVDAPEGKAYLDEEIDGLTEALAAKPGGKAKADLEKALAAFKARKASLGAAPCDLSWVWQERRAWRDVACRRVIDAGYADGPLPGLPAHAYGDETTEQALAWSTIVQDLYGAWPGPAYVLTDGKTFSSAEMFAATMKDNGAAKTIGVRTGGDGCGFMGDVPPLVLAHSRLRFRVPNCMRLRADGTDEVAGIAPDLPIAPTEGESDRARAARLLRTVAAELEPGR